MKTPSVKNLPKIQAALLAAGLFANASAFAMTYTYRVPAKGVMYYAWSAEGGAGASVPPPAAVSAATPGRYGAAAIKVDGTLWTSGGVSGQLPSANGAPTTRKTFAPIYDTSKFVNVSVNGGHMLAIKDNGTLWGTGQNDSGQLGDGTTTDRTGTLVQVGNGASGFVLASGGYNFSVALKQDGTIWGTGYNYSGNFGGPAGAMYTNFVNLANGEKFVWVGAVYDGAFALKADGTLWNVGRNDAGGLGDGTCGTGMQCWKYPWGPAGGTNRFTKVAPSNWWTVALKADGTLWCAGSSYGGRFGVAASGVWKDFGACAPGHFFTDVATGADHTLAVKADGSLWASGDNTNGQFGNGSTTSSSTFIRVDGGQGPFVKVMATWWGDGSMALHADGSLWVTGSNNLSFGHLGAGTTGKVLTWTRILP